MSEDSPAVTAVLRANAPDPSKKVCIVGFASSSRGLAPYDDPSWEVWGLNHGWLHVPEERWTRWFEIHPKEQVLKDVKRNGETVKGPDHFEWLRKWPKERGPIYMQEHLPEIPASVRWPRAEMNAWFASMGDNDVRKYAPDYYTSSISQMLTTAMFEGYGEILIVGVDLLQEEEYFYQRAGCEYLIGLARGMGIKVIIPNESALCKASYVYGYSEPPNPETFNPLIKYVKDRAKECGDNKVKLIASLEAVNTSSQLAVMVRDNWVGKALEKVQATTTSLEPEVQEQINKALVAFKDEVSSCAMNQIGQFNQARLKIAQQLGVVEGQESAFGCMDSWAGHFQRGGVLESTKT